jgi:CRP-like cAMP-binding protein
MYSNAATATLAYSPDLTDPAFRKTPAVPIVRPLHDHHYWSFFKQAELATGMLFNESERNLFSALSKTKKLRRRQYFLQEGDACRFIGFIIKGAVKTYTVNERGQESILSFGLENEWLTDMESFLEGKESEYHIEALEELEMIILDKDQLTRLITEIPAMNEFINCFQTKQLIELQKRINVALSMTAEERYLNLLATKPAYGQRFSQNLLACYIGCKPETLSRFRKQ